MFFGNRILKPGAEALAEFQKALMVYPLGSEPSPVKFITGVDKPWSGTPPTGLDYFKAVHRAIQGEPVLPQDKPYMAFLASLGIEDGKPFNPDSRMAKLLAEGANIGELMAARTRWSIRTPNRTGKALAGIACSISLWLKSMRSVLTLTSGPRGSTRRSHPPVRCRPIRPVLVKST